MSNFFQETSIVSKSALIDTSSKGTNTYIGSNSVVDAFVRIKHVGGSGDVSIGDSTYINSGTVIYSGNGVTIGNNVLIGPNCTIVPTNHEYRSRIKKISEQGFMQSRGGVIIEDDVWIGAGVILLDGTHIKKGATIGAGSLIKGEVEAYSIHVGNPSREVGKR